jgi:hypothetical protein
MVHQKIKTFFSKNSHKKKLKALLNKAWGTDNDIMARTQDIVEAFHLSMKKNYPNIPKDWDKITVYQATQILKDHVSRNTITSYLKKGYLRNEGGMVYRQEVEMFKQGLDAVQFLYDNGVLAEKKVNGQQMIVFFPTQLAREGLHKLDQKGKASARTFKSNFFKDWMENIDDKD